ANGSGHTPVVFIHGLWLLAGSWDRWAALFADAGYAPVTPGWPDDPETVERARAHPDVFAGKTVGRVAGHYAEIIGRLDRKPAVIGHSVCSPRSSPAADCPLPRSPSMPRLFAECSHCPSAHCAQPPRCSATP